MLDFQIFQTINHLAVTESFLNPLMKFLSQDAEYLFFLAIIIYWFIRTKANRRMVAEGIISACVALGLNALIGIFFYRDRPFVHHHVIKLISHVANASFPSDHATGAFVIATSIWIWRKRDGWIWLLIAAGIALSRVWTGVHYPSDVVAGMLIGIMTALLIHVLMHAWKFANNLLNDIVGFYERMESKVWKGKDASNF